MNVEQIRYSHYKQKLAAGHEDYWEVIDILAADIGARLEARGLKVAQTKEKFGRAVVYLSGRPRNAAQRRAYHEVYAEVIAGHPAYRSAILSGSDAVMLALPEPDELERYITNMYEAQPSLQEVAWITREVRQARFIHKKRKVHHGQAGTDHEDAARGVSGREKP